MPLFIPGPVVNATGDMTTTSTDAGAGTGPSLILDRFSATPANADDIGRVLFRGRDAAAAETDYAAIYANIMDVTNGSEDGFLSFQTISGGTLASRFVMSPGLWSLNATGGDKGVDTVNALEYFENGISQKTLFKVITADATAASSASAQPWFPSAGAVTVTGDTTYLVNGILNVSNGTTSHTTGINFGGTATITSFSIGIRFTSGAINTTLPSNSAAGTSSLYTAHMQWLGTTDMATNVVLNATSVLTGAKMEIYGIIRINAGGTLIPRFQWSANPTGTNLVLKNTWFSLVPIGAGAFVSKGTWA